MIPIFTYGVYPFVEKIGIKVTPLRKIGAGLQIA
jgi:POT family proton-dependent oligopeptide transporter